MEQPLIPVTPVVAGKRSTPSAAAILLVVAALVAVGGVTFAVGRLTAPVAAASTRGAGNGGFFGNGPFASGAPGTGRQNGLGGLFGAGGLTIRGTVSAIAGDALSITLSSGTTVQIPLDASTTYHRQAAATGTDIGVGSVVLVELSGGQGGQASPAPSPRPSGATRLGPAQDVTIVTP